MRKRGRPPHPDILTPREWEVLELLRADLTNEQIADRLGITLDGAKYHVSEILSKLGVSSREQAAAWQPAVEQPLWRRAISLPLFAKAAGIAVIAAAIAGLAFLGWTVIANDDSQTTDEIEPALQDLYDRVLEAVTREDEILYTVEHYWYLREPREPGDEPRLFELGSARWIDGSLGVARDDSKHGPIHTDSYQYTYSSTTNQMRQTETSGSCPGSDSVILGLLLSCHRWPTTPSLADWPDDLPEPPAITREIEPAVVGETPTIVITFRVHQEGNDAVISRIHLDAQSMLRVLEEWTEREWATFDHEFVPRGGLPADFFDPESLRSASDVGSVD